ARKFFWITKNEPDGDPKMQPAGRSGMREKDWTPPGAPSSWSEIRPVRDSLRIVAQGRLQRPGRYADDGLTVGNVPIAGHDGVGSDHGIVPDLHRRHEDRAGADAAPAADPCPVFLRTVVVGRDRRGAEVDVFSQVGIAQVGQVADDRPAAA